MLEQKIFFYNSTLMVS